MVVQPDGCTLWCARSRGVKALQRLPYAALIAHAPPNCIRAEQRVRHDRRDPSIGKALAPTQAGAETFNPPMA